MEHRWISAGILCWWNLSITLECKLCHLGEFYSLGKCITREEGSLTTSYSSWQPLSAATAAKLHQLCPTLCDPIDSSPTGSSVPGILQARILEWVAISFSNHESEKWFRCPVPWFFPTLSSCILLGVLMLPTDWLFTICFQVTIFQPRKFSYWDFQAHFLQLSFKFISMYFHTV